MYTATLSEHENENGTFNDQITLLYDLVGEFFKDLGQFSISQGKNSIKSKIYILFSVLLVCT